MFILNEDHGPVQQHLYSLPGILDSGWAEISLMSGVSRQSLHNAQTLLNVPILDGTPLCTQNRQGHNILQSQTGLEQHGEYV